MTKARDIASAAPAPSTVSATEIGYLDGVTSAIQTQIDSKIGSASAINPTIVDAKGDLLVGSAADTVARLAVGTNNYVLTADSAATNGIKWAAAAAGGKVLQVVSTTTSTETSTTSTSYTDATDLTATITPSSTNSKILILMSIGVDCTTAGITDNGVKGQIVRASTNIWTTDYFYGRNNSTGNRQNSSIVYLDSPASTSALTYKFQFARFGGTATAVINRNGGYSTITLLEIGA